MAKILCRRIAGWCSVIISPRSPGRARWLVRCWRRSLDFLPGTLWILIGATLGGGVHDMIVLFASVRRGGKRSAKWSRKKSAAASARSRLISVLAIMIILLAVLALVVVQALAKSPWGVFTIAMTIPVAFIMGVGLRSGKVNVTCDHVFRIARTGFAVWGGQFLSHFPALEAWFRHDQKWLAWAIMIYGLAASILPVWMLLTPRDYLSTFLETWDGRGAGGGGDLHCVRRC